MTRTAGAKNIVPWASRLEIATTARRDIRHLAKSSYPRPVDEFKQVIEHQRRYLAWIESRHKQLMTLKKGVLKNKRGPKDAVFEKYRWYAGQQTLFEAVNSFEVFYKQTFINLAAALRRYVRADKIKGAVDAKVLWAMRGKASVSALIFEHQLFHDLEQADKCSSMLVDSKRYNPGSPSAAMKPIVRGLQGAFQIRHTLAHNQGYVTTSDCAKFTFIGFTTEQFEVIDPLKENTGEALRRFLLQEAKDYTEWLLNATADFLQKAHHDGLPLIPATLKRLDTTLGSNAKLSALPWK